MTYTYLFTYIMALATMYFSIIESERRSRK